MSPPSVPLVLLFGPSGAGKSTLCLTLSETLGWLHIETDAYSKSAASAAEPKSLSRVFSETGQFGCLATELRELAVPSHAGAIVSFVSMASPSLEQINAARSAGIAIVYLFGEENECLGAFLRREASTGRNLPESHWRTYNTTIYKHCRQPEYEPYRLLAFRDGVHRPVEELAAELRTRNVG